MFRDGCHNEYGDLDANAVLVGLHSGPIRYLVFFYWKAAGSLVILDGDISPKKCDSYFVDRMLESVEPFGRTSNRCITVMALLPVNASPGLWR